MNVVSGIIGGAAVLFFIVILILAVLQLLRRALHASPASPGTSIEVPKIARMKIVHTRCRVCDGPLLDGELVTWHEVNGRPVDMSSHANCSVIILSDFSARTNTARRPDGTPVPRGPDGAVLVPTTSNTIVVQESEWLLWTTSSPAGFDTADTPAPSAQRT